MLIIFAIFHSSERDTQTQKPASPKPTYNDVQNADVQLCGVQKLELK